LSGEGEYFCLESQTYTYTSTNVDFDTDILHGYQSMATPSSVIDFNMKTKEKVVLKEQQVLGGKFDKKYYIEERVWATAQDGTKFQSLWFTEKIWKRMVKIRCYFTHMVLTATYGCLFSTTRLSLLDRGFIYAIAHIRGGEDLGRQWYDDGKLLKKKNTFTDFIDCSCYYVYYTSAKHLYAEGGSRRIVNGSDC
jgi:oligopeptidase B